jgi:hypothetical protein
MKQPLVADQKYFFPAQPAGAGTHLAQHAPAENYFRHFKFVVMQCITLHFFHYIPFVANQRLALHADLGESTQTMRAYYKQCLCLIQNLVLYFYPFASSIVIIFHLPAVSPTILSDRRFLGQFSTV